MKKRFVTTLLALIACIACVVGLVACGEDDAGSVTGKTYVFEKVEITEGLSGEEKTQLEAQLNKVYEGSTISFDEETSFSMTMTGHRESGTYRQSGNKLTLTLDGEDLEGKLSGNTLTLSNSSNGMSAQMIYKLASTDDATDPDPNEGDGSTTSSVAGKTYVMTDYLINGTSVFDEMELEGAAISFGANGVCTMMEGNETRETATYTENGNTVTITFDGESMDFTVSGNTLTVTVNIDENGKETVITEVFTLQQ